MNRRTYVERLGAAVVASAIAGCTGDETGGRTDEETAGAEPDDGGGSDTTDTAYGILSTSVTDQPNDIADFESLVVTIEGIWVKPSGADEDAGTADEDDGVVDDEGGENDDGSNDEHEGGDGATVGETDANDGSGRHYIEFELPQEADLVDLQGDETQLVDETELAVGDYRFLQLDVSETTGILDNGGDAVVETPGNAPLQFKHAFEIRPEETTRFIADFAPFRRGNGAYLIRPVASGTQVIYGDDAYEGGGDEEDAGSDVASDDGNSGSDMETADDTGSDPGGGSGTGSGPDHAPGQGNGPPGGGT